MHALSYPPFASAAPVAGERRGRPGVIVVDDHPFVGELLAAYLETSGAFRLLGTATHGDEALTLCRELRPDLLILDLVMPGRSGLEVLRAVKAEGLPTRCVVFTSLDCPEALREAISAGACGYLAKRTSFSEMIHGLEKVARGEFAFTPDAMELVRRSVRSADSASVLSDSEVTVLRRIALGHGAKQIAADEALSESGVYRVIERLKRKLAAGTVQELTLIAVRHGLLPL